LLYGISLLYGFTGQIGFREISIALKGENLQLGVIFGIVFILAGLAFKISAVPFHMWTPDVYEGAPSPITAFFAGAPKVAAMALIIRVIVAAFIPLGSTDGSMPAWQQILVFMAIASMILGAFAAIGQ
ncbi:proton-conducting transporter transmembrane domain-containing protein, partial [Bartonella grahamii]|uniref:proton-conducting transporter transmembrane domain-containing protein n=1 Tax=Bartonella grahamii TaxID=33045 RepID=UPI0024855026